MIWPAVTMPAEALAAGALRSSVQGRMGGLRRGAGRIHPGDAVLRPAQAGPGGRPPDVLAASIGSCVHKWWFDELYAFLFVRPVLRVSGWVAAIDKNGIDWLADNWRRAVEFDFAHRRLDRPHLRRWLGELWPQWTYALGLRLRAIQTGNIRQYVMWIAVGAVAIVRVNEYVLESADRGQ